MKISRSNFIILLLVSAFLSTMQIVNNYYEFTAPIINLINLKLGVQAADLSTTSIIVAVIGSLFYLAILAIATFLISLTMNAKLAFSEIVSFLSVATIISTLITFLYSEMFYKHGLYLKIFDKLSALDKTEIANASQILGEQGINMSHLGQVNALAFFMSCVFSVLIIGFNREKKFIKSGAMIIPVAVSTALTVFKAVV